ncbi:MAG: cation:dicarboxylase symporter family transporter [Lachnospiraceae bacterium]|nr:cation:dicarboxylase symporter family transporter [Lachnospiraceae bacterium]
MEWITLKNEEIDRVSQELVSFFKEKGIEKKEITRSRLILEEILFKYQMRFGEDHKASVNFTTVLSQVRCYIRLQGEAYNPLEISDDSEAKLIGSLLDYEGGTPNWTYRNSDNVILMVSRRKRKVSLIGQIAIALVAGVVLGIAARNGMNPDYAAVLVTDYLQPIANAYTGILCVMAVLLTFFAFPLGISAIGNLESVGKASKKLVVRMYAVMTAAVLAFTVFFLLSGKTAAHTSIAIAGKSLFDIVIGFFPTGLVDPFLNFNSIQILIIGMMFGFSFLAMGEKAGKVLEIFDTCNLAAIITNNFLNKFIPYYVGISVFSGIVTADISALSTVPQILIYALVGFLLLIVYYAVTISIRFKVNPISYCRTMLPTFLISLSSGSFGAAFTTMINTVLSFGPDPALTGMYINIGGVFFKPAHSITFLVSSVIMARVFGIEISVSWLIFAALLSVILTVAVPNVPGASAPVYALLFSHLGLPGAALVLMISINAFLEFLMVAVNIFCLQSEVTLQLCDEVKV